MKTNFLAAAALTLLTVPALALPVALSAVNNPDTRIANANVRDTNGQIVGAVQRVNLDAQGMPATVSVAMLGGGDKLVLLNAGKVKYDADRNEVIADSSRKQLQFFHGQN